MATENDYQGLYDRIAALREQVASRLSADLVANPQLADAITKQIDDMLASVVDADLKVYGIDNLRIADGSIMPRVTTGNTMAPCVVIGERAGELLKRGL